MKKFLFFALAAVTLIAAECNPDPVIIPVSGITITPDGIVTMGVGTSVALTANITPPDASNQEVTWSSDNTVVATVSSTGVVTGVSAGFAIISATATDGSAIEGTRLIAVKTFPSGDGTEANPYLIRTPKQLDAVREDLVSYYKLGNNIDLTGYLAPGGAGYAKWGTEGWMPIGDDTDWFAGGLDGAGFIINGLMINRPTMFKVGMFGYTVSYIKNLGLENVDVTGFYGVGALVGDADFGSITNCYVTGVVNGDGVVGGIAGEVSSSIICCYSNASVNSIIPDINGCAGGIAGLAGGLLCNIVNCYATGAVSGDNGVGGLVGINDANITNCYATGSVIGKTSVGGVAGQVHANSKITNCITLNTSVAETGYHYPWIYVGRVIGLDGGTLTNNWAWSGMTVKYNSGVDKSPLMIGGSQLDGADCAAVPLASWWTTVAPGGPGWDGLTVWLFADGQLPKLRWQK